jgi:hypothetical protein
MIGWHEDFEDLADECPEDFEEQWAFEQALNAEAADYRQAEALQAADSFPANEDDNLPPPIRVRGWTPPPPRLTVNWPPTSASSVCTMSRWPCRFLIPSPDATASSPSVRTASASARTEPASRSRGHQRKTATAPGVVPGAGSLAVLGPDEERSVGVASV